MPRQLFTAEDIRRLARERAGPLVLAPDDIVTHEAQAGQVEAALQAIRDLPESRGEASALPVVSSRGVEELGWA